MDEISGLIPWGKSINIDQNISIDIPVIESENIISENPWMWDTMEGDWVINNGVLFSQNEQNDANIDSIASSKIIETNFINVEDKNRILLQLYHKYETEWDHDFINIQIIDYYDNILLND